MFKDEAKQQKAAEEEQAAIIAKLKAENEILKAKAAKCKCEAFGKVKQMPSKSFSKSPQIVPT